MVNIVPRMLGSQISEMYEFAGASFNPIQNPITANATQITENERAKPSTIQAIEIGMVRAKMDFCRPYLSQIMILKRLPIGCTINVQLAANGQ